jgi:hypothetical protein
MTTISDQQMRAVEGCCRLVVQRIANVRIADAALHTVAERPKSYSSAHLRDVEKAGRFADSALKTSIDELKDQLATIPSETVAAVTA